MSGMDIFDSSVFFHEQNVIDCSLAARHSLFLEGIDRSIECVILVMFYMVC